VVFLDEQDGHSPLYVAANSGKVEIVRQLLAMSDIDVNSVDKVRLFSFCSSLF
jgi:ankyrin repeat protein